MDQRLLAIIALTTGYFALGAEGRATPCACFPAPAERGTFLGHEQQPRRLAVADTQGISGIVVAEFGGHAYSDALVELFLKSKDGNAFKRVAGCITGSRGEFCLRVPRTGKFELVVSNPGCNAIFYDLTVTRKRLGRGPVFQKIELPLAY